MATHLYKLNKQGVWVRHSFTPAYVRWLHKKGFQIMLVKGSTHILIDPAGTVIIRNRWFRNVPCH